MLARFLRSSAFPVAVAFVGLLALAVVGGDPRGARSLDASTVIALAGLALALGVGALAGRGARSRWLLVPSLALAAMGALTGWIAAAEILGDPAHAAHTPGRAAFLLALTASGMSLPPLGLAWIFKPRGRGRT
jgi:hypothetical protein